MLPNKINNIFSSCNCNKSGMNLVLNIKKAINIIEAFIPAIMPCLNPLNINGLLIKERVAPTKYIVLIKNLCEYIESLIVLLIKAIATNIVTST